MRRKLIQVREPGRDRWMVSYADLMTLLFALFAVLFARNLKAHSSGAQNAPSAGTNLASPVVAPEAHTLHSVRVAAQQTVPTQDDVERAQTRTATRQAAELRNDIEASLAGEIAKGEVTVRSSPAGLVVSLGEVGYFRSGEARLLPEAAAKVDRIGRILSIQGADLRIEGYSDDQPIHSGAFHSNWELSTARAESVLELMVARSGIEPSRISVAGYGSYHSLASNKTSAGRGVNRRVDLVILQKTADGPGTMARDTAHP